MGNKKDVGDIVAGCIALVAIVLLVVMLFAGLVGGAVAGLYYMYFALQAGAVLKGVAWAVLAIFCSVVFGGWAVSYFKGV